MLKKRDKHVETLYVVAVAVVVAVVVQEGAN